MTLIALVSEARELIARFHQTVSDCACLNVIIIVVSGLVVGRNYRQGGANSPVVNYPDRCGLFPAKQVNFSQSFCGQYGVSKTRPMSTALAKKCIWPGNCSLPE